VADFYAGKTVTIVAGYPAGDGFDLYARLIAKHLPKHLPGSPTILVRNMIGAGSLVAANFVHEAAVQDGTNIALIGSGIPFSPLLGVKEAKFDPVKLNWLPSPNIDISGVVVWHESATKNLEDARKKETLLATATTNSTSSFYGRLLNEVLGTKFKLIPGYNGLSPVFLAMERGEIEGHPSVTYSTLKATKPDWIADKKVNVLVQFGRNKHSAWPDTPFLRDLVKSEDDKLLVDMAGAPLTLGRPFFVGADVPADRVSALRKAFMETYRDPDLRAEAQMLRLEFADDPVTGEEIQALIAKTYSAPVTVINRLRALYDVQP
jgi:tripartite-type tricarboxylate transporter receptor subunit TctC